MVIAAYVAGLISTPAAFLGALGGVWVYRRVRRAQSVSEPVALDTWVPPPPPPPQDAPVLNRISLRNVPGQRRKIRGHK